MPSRMLDRQTKGNARGRDWLWIYTFKSCQNKTKLNPNKNIHLNPHYNTIGFFQPIKVKDNQLGIMLVAQLSSPLKKD